MDIETHRIVCVACVVARACGTDDVDPALPVAPGCVARKSARGARSAA